MNRPKQKLLPPAKPATNGKKINYPARVNVAKSVAAGRRAGIRPEDIRKILASGRLGRTIPDAEMKQIAKGVKFDRWAMLKNAIAQCDKRMKIKNLPDDIWVAINKAKSEYLSEMSQLTHELDDIGNKAPQGHNGALSPHSFGPREQIGNVTAVQVTIGEAQKTAPIYDVKSEKVPGA